MCFTAVVPEVPLEKRYTYYIHIELHLRVSPLWFERGQSSHLRTLQKFPRAIKMVYLRIDLSNSCITIIAVSREQFKNVFSNKAAIFWPCIGAKFRTNPTYFRRKDGGGHFCEELHILCLIRRKHPLTSMSISRMSTSEIKYAQESSNKKSKYYSLIFLKRC